MEFEKGIIGLKYLSKSQIERIVETAFSMRDISKRPIKKVPTLRGKTVVNLFFESSTRTKTSFEIAAKRLSADVVNFSYTSSSISKGETTIDTAKNIEAMNPDVFVIRHSSSGVMELLSRHLKTPIINAGDGTNEHPTQGLLDIMTIMEEKKHIDGLKIIIAGDIYHSRVARSDIYGMGKLGAKIYFFSPPTLITQDYASLGASVTYDFKEAFTDADVIIMLRIQLERQTTGLFPSTREYSRIFGLNEQKLRLAKPDVIVMHPGPINRGLELSSSVANSEEHSRILKQVENGVAIRMSAIFHTIGEGHEYTDN
ncbi:MAG: aspartate carbamoyltransferase catalytic subunit [bacterium]